MLPVVDFCTVIWIDENACFCYEEFDNYADANKFAGELEEKAIVVPVAEVDIGWFD